MAEAIGTWLVTEGFYVAGSTAALTAGEALITHAALFNYLAAMSVPVNIGLAPLRRPALSNGATEEQA